jgi:hypothetical protein
MRTEVDGEDGEGFGAWTGRVVSSLMGTKGPLRGLAARTFRACIGIGDGSSIDLFELIDGGECLGKLYGSKK